MTKPDVSLAAVIGVAHQSHGGDVNAEMILVEGATITAVDPIEWDDEHLDVPLFRHPLWPPRSKSWWASFGLPRKSRL